MTDDIFDFITSDTGEGDEFADNLGDSIGSVEVIKDGESQGVQCVLCDNTAETPEEHEQHMAEVHDA